MITQRVVAHCLVVWNTYAGNIDQEDKDFFDEKVAGALTATQDEFLAIFELTAARIQRDGAGTSNAVATAQILVSSYARAWGEELKPLASFKE